MRFDFHMRSCIPKNWRSSPLGLPFAILFLLAFVPPVFEFTFVQLALSPRVPSVAVHSRGAVVVTRTFAPTALEVGDVLLAVDGVPLDGSEARLAERGASIAAGELFHLQIRRGGRVSEVAVPAMVPRFAKEQLPFAILALSVLTMAALCLFVVPPSIKTLAILLTTPYAGGIVGAMAANPTTTVLTPLSLKCLALSIGPLVVGVWMIGMYLPFPLPSFRGWRRLWRWLLVVGALLTSLLLWSNGRSLVFHVTLVAGFGLSIAGLIFSAFTMIWRLRLRPPARVRHQLHLFLSALVLEALGATALLVSIGPVTRLVPLGWDFWFILAGAVLMIPLFPSMLGIGFDLNRRAHRRVLARFTHWLSTGVATLVGCIILSFGTPRLTEDALDLLAVLLATLVGAGAIARWHRSLGRALVRWVISVEPDAWEREQVIAEAVQLIGRSGLRRAGAQVTEALGETYGCRWVRLYMQHSSQGSVAWEPVATAWQRAAATDTTIPERFETTESLLQAFERSPLRFVASISGPAGLVGVIGGELDTQVRRTSTLSGEERSSLDVLCFRATAAIEMAHQVRQVGPYRLTHHLASGGMGAVYVAEDVRFDAAHPVIVLKRLLPELLGSDEHIARFLTEAEVAKALDHPGIVETYEAGRDASGVLYIAMEYVRGGDAGLLLKHCRSTSTPVEPRLAFGIGARVCEALAYAHGTATGRKHATPIVHRDISPDNILLALDGTVKLADFGVAVEVATATSLQAEMGKIPFMAPERLDGHGATPLSDLFSLGVVLYELLTLHHPFSQTTRDATLDAIRAGRPIPLSSLLPDVHPEPLAIIMNALKADPGRRPRTAADMGGVLERHADSAVHAEQALAHFSALLSAARGASTLSASDLGGEQSGSDRLPPTTAFIELERGRSQ